MFCDISIALGVFNRSFPSGFKSFTRVYSHLQITCKRLVNGCNWPTCWDPLSWGSGCPCHTDGCWKGSLWESNRDWWEHNASWNSTPALDWHSRWTMCALIWGNLAVNCKNRLGHWSSGTAPWDIWTLKESAAGGQNFGYFMWMSHLLRKASWDALGKSGDSTSESKVFSGTATSTAKFLGQQTRQCTHAVSTGITKDYPQFPIYGYYILGSIIPESLSKPWL